MNRKTQQLLVIAAAASLAGLLFVQVYWFAKAFDVQEKQFDERINLALRAAGNDLLMLQGDQNSRIKPVAQLASNAFRLHLDQYFNYNSVDSLVKLHLQNHQIDLPYQVSMYNSQGDSIMWGRFMVDGPLSVENLCIDRSQEIVPHFFVITFPNKTAHLASHMEIWIFSAFTFMLVLFIFSGMVLQVVKQRKLAEIKTDFINNMTHELKTPLSNISVASEVLKKPNAFLDEERKQRYAEIIFNESQLLKQQIEHVLMVAKLETGALKLHFNLININVLIEEAAKNICPRIYERNGVLSLDLKAEKFMVKADDFHVRSMLYSLLDNADKYSPEKPEILVKTSNTAEGILIEITDNGAGIRKENLQHIFEKFYRAPQGNLHNTAGYGLGLSYVKMVVDAHQGKIQVESQIQKGSTFGIILKVA